MTCSDWTLAGAAGQTIFGNTHLPPDGVQPRGVLLVCHGFKGYKDYGFFPRLAETAADRGLIAHRFNFSHSGMTPDIDRFERPDLFEQDTWNKQIHDLLTVARAVADGTLAGQNLPVCWFGHSRGGVTVLLAGSRVKQAPDAAAIRPSAIITAASPDQACSLSDADKQELRSKGRLASPSSRTGQVLYIGRSWLDEIETDPQGHDLLRAVAQAPCPLLIVHGTADTTVPVAAARHLTDAAGSRATLQIIGGASHTFDAPNPLPADEPLPPATHTLFELTCGFALQHAS